MVAEKKTPSRRKKIPDYLIREMIDGQPLYYKGYRDVLRKKKTVEEIMGSSSFQAILVAYLNRIIVEGKLYEKYEVLTGEAGLHIDTNNNLAGDILLYDLSVFNISQASVHFANVPPKIDIEIDIMIEAENLQDQQYIRKKTEKLHRFGTEKVIWILSAARQIIVALPDDPWMLYDWNQNIEIIDGVYFNIGEYLKKRGVQIAE
jgi:hypothetical protein